MAEYPMKSIIRGSMNSTDSRSTHHRHRSNRRSSQGGQHGPHSVHFPPAPYHITSIHTRPRTHVMDRPSLYYTARQMEKLKRDYYKDLLQQQMERPGSTRGFSFRRHAATATDRGRNSYFNIGRPKDHGVRGRQQSQQYDDGSSMSLSVCAKSISSISEPTSVSYESNIPEQRPSGNPWRSFMKDTIREPPASTPSSSVRPYQPHQLSSSPPSSSKSINFQNSSTKSYVKKHSTYSTASSFNSTENFSSASDAAREALSRLIVTPKAA